MKAAQLIRRLRAWAAGRYGDAATIGAKHPSLCLCVPECAAAWPTVRFVRVTRPLQDSVASVRRRFPWPPASIEPTLRHMIQTRDAALAEVNRPTITIDYEALLGQPETHIEQLARFADVAASDEALTAAHAFVRPSLQTFGKAPHGHD